MPLRRKIFPVLFCSAIFLSSGCLKAAPPAASIHEAHQKFLKLCREEYHYSVVTKKLANTFWIYVPMEEEMITVKSSLKGAQESSGYTDIFSLQFVAANLDNNTWRIQYDISPGRKYAKDPGYTNGYSESYQKIQNNILSVVSRAFFDVEKPPEFFVLVLADIKGGLESKNIFYFQDFKRAMSLPPSLSQEEYAKRYLSELTGDPKVTGDKTGAHLAFKEITWPEFLARQIEYRVRFKYQQSSFPPSGESAQQLLDIAREVFEAYDVKNFEAVEVRDVISGKTKTVSRDDLHLSGK